MAWVHRAQSNLLLGALAILLAVAAPPLPGDGEAAASTLTNRGDSGRSAWYSDQPALSPDAVASGDFGEIFATQLQGVITAQPIVVGDVVVAATQDDFVYGLDRVSGDVLWSTRVGQAIAQRASQGCGDLVNSGVTATPVASDDGSAVYLTAKTYRSGSSGPMDYQLHALDPQSGAELPGYPVTYGGAADNDPNWTFDATFQTQRPGLLLDQGVVYAAFGSVCDLGTFTGWVIGIDVATRATTARWVSEAGQPPTAEGGIWQAGSGLASDGPGELLLVSGNGIAPPMPTAGSSPPGALGESVVRLHVDENRKLHATDFFTPSSAELLNNLDADFGSGGVVLLPDGFSTADHPHLVASIGKEGTLYLLDAADLGGAGTGVGGGDRTVAQLAGLGGVWGSPVGFPGDGGLIYLTSTGGPGFAGAQALTAVRWGLNPSGSPELSVAGRSTDQPGFGSGSPVVTSNGSDPSTALVWQTWKPTAGGDAELRAYRAVPVGGQLEQVWSAPIGTMSKFMSPAVDRGRLYLGSADGVLRAFGSPTTQAFSAAQSTFTQVPVASSASGTVTLTASRPVTLSAMSLAEGAFALGGGGPALPRSLSDGEELEVPLTFSPSRAGSVTSALLLSVDGEAAQRVSLTGQGVYAQGHLAWELAFLDLGTTTLGAPVVATSAILSNYGATSVTVAAVTAPQAPISTTGTLVGTTIPPGSSVSVPVRMATTQTGSFTSSFTVTGSSGQGSRLDILGSVGTASMVEISPAQVSFGTLPTGHSSIRTLTLRNTGTTAAAVTISKPPGLAASEITNLTPLPEGSVIPPLGELKLKLRFAPKNVGSHVDSWEISTGDLLGRRSIRLSGVAVKNAELPQLRVDDAEVASNFLTAPFSVKLSRATDRAVTFTVSTVPGSAPASAYAVLRPTKLSIPAGQTEVPLWTWVWPSQGLGTDFGVQVTKVANAIAVDATAKVRIRAPGAGPIFHARADDVSATVNQVEDQEVRVPLSVSGVLRPVEKCEVHSADASATVGGGDYRSISGAVVSVTPQGTGYVVIELPASRAEFSTRSFQVVVDRCTNNVVVDDPVATVTLYGQHRRASVLEASAGVTILRAEALGLQATSVITVTNVGGAAATLRRIVAPRQAFGFSVTADSGLPVVVTPGASVGFTVRWQAQSSSTGAQPLQLAGSSTLKLSLIGRLR